MNLYILYNDGKNRIRWFKTENELIEFYEYLIINKIIYIGSGMY